MKSPKELLKEAIDKPAHTDKHDAYAGLVKKLSSQQKKDWADAITKHHENPHQAASMFAKGHPELKNHAKKMADLKKYLA